MPDRGLDPWLNEQVPTDASLKDVLQMSGYARRLIFAKRILEELGFGDRVYSDRLTAPTYRLAYDMLDHMADAIHKQRVNVRDRGERIAANLDLTDRRPDNLSGPDATQAAIELGWGHLPVSAGSVLEVQDAVKRTYIDKMTQHVVRLLRTWEKAGLLVDVTAA